MRNILYIIFFLIISFLLNILAYYFSSDYRDFLKKVKGTDEKVNIEKTVEEFDEYTIDVTSMGTKKDEVDEEEDEDLVQKDDFKQEKDEKQEDDIISNSGASIDTEEDLDNTKVEYISVIEELKLTDIEEEFLNIFKEYSFKELQLHPRLLDLTSEYPDKYFEYYSEYLSLYFFGNKPYSEIKDIFEVLAYELPFEVNEINNFGDKSFYVNLEQDFQDGVVRMIVLYKNRTFGFKIKQEVYPHVKGKLESLKK